MTTTPDRATQRLVPMPDTGSPQPPPNTDSPGYFVWIWAPPPERIGWSESLQEEINRITALVGPLVSLTLDRSLPNRYPEYTMVLEDRRPS